MYLKKKEWEKIRKECQLRIKQYYNTNIELKKFKILIHPKSYVHAIIKLKNGLIKLQCLVQLA